MASFLNLLGSILSGEKATPSSDKTHKQLQVVMTAIVTPFLSAHGPTQQSLKVSFSAAKQFVCVDENTQKKMPAIETMPHYTIKKLFELQKGSALTGELLPDAAPLYDAARLEIFDKNSFELQASILDVAVWIASIAAILGPRHDIIDLVEKTTRFLPVSGGWRVSDRQPALPNAKSFSSALLFFDTIYFISSLLPIFTHLKDVSSIPLFSSFRSWLDGLEHFRRENNTNPQLHQGWVDRVAGLLLASSTSNLEGIENVLYFRSSLIHCLDKMDSEALSKRYSLSSPASVVTFCSLIEPFTIGLLVSPSPRIFLGKISNNTIQFIDDLIGEIFFGVISRLNLPYTRRKSLDPSLCTALMELSSCLDPNLVGRCALSLPLMVIDNGLLTSYKKVSNAGSKLAEKWLSVVCHPVFDFSFGLDGNGKEMILASTFRDRILSTPRHEFDFFLNLLEKQSVLDKTICQNSQFADFIVYHLPKTINALPLNDPPLLLMSKQRENLFRSLTASPACIDVLQSELVRLNDPHKALDALNNTRIWEAHNCYTFATRDQFLRRGRDYRKGDFYFLSSEEYTQRPLRVVEMLHDVISTFTAEVPVATTDRGAPNSGMRPPAEVRLFFSPRFLFWFSLIEEASRIDSVRQAYWEHFQKLGEKLKLALTSSQQVSSLPAAHILSAVVMNQFLSAQISNFKKEHHANHLQKIDAAVADACDILTKFGTSVFKVRESHPTDKVGAYLLLQDIPEEKKGGTTIADRCFPLSREFERMGNTLREMVNCNGDHRNSGDKLPRWLMKASMEGAQKELERFSTWPSPRLCPFKTTTHFEELAKLIEKSKSIIRDEINKITIEDAFVAWTITLREDIIHLFREASKNDNVIDNAPPSIGLHRVFPQSLENALSEREALRCPPEHTTLELAQEVLEKIASISSTKV